MRVLILQYFYCSDTGARHDLISRFDLTAAAQYQRRYAAIPIGSITFSQQRRLVRRACRSVKKSRTARDAETCRRTARGEDANLCPRDDGAHESARCILSRTAGLAKETATFSSVQAVR